MPKYMLVAYDDPAAFTDVSADQIQEIVAKYTAWTQRIAEEGKLVSGEKLVDGRGKVLSRSNGSMSVEEGPVTEAREVIGGTWIIQCDNEQEALAVASSCPHVEFSRLGFYQVDEV